MKVRKLLHILATDSLGEREVLVRFSDGTTAVYEREELEKLRPRSKPYSDEYRVA
jgi:hypothetical protein